MKTLPTPYWKGHRRDPHRRERSAGRHGDATSARAVANGKDISRRATSGHVGKHIMAHIGARAFAAFDDRHVNIYMDNFNADNFDHEDLGFIRGAQIPAGPAGLDAQTREIMQTELLRTWERGHKTVLFVTHQIDEAVFLADRVLVFAHRPGRLQAEVKIDLPRPRILSMKRTPEFVSSVDRIWRMIEDDVRAAALFENV